MVAKHLFHVFIIITCLFIILTKNYSLQSIEVVIALAAIFFGTKYNEKKYKIKILTLERNNQKALLQNLFRHFPDLMFVKNKDFVYTDANYTFFEILGKNVINKTDFEIFDEECAQRFRKSDMKIIETQTSMKFIAKLGSLGNIQRTFEVIKSPLISNHEVVGILGIARDITDTEAIESQKETFLATLTHDLKTPTIAQKKALELLLNKNFGELNEEQQSVIFETKKSCDYMLAIISNILEIHQKENGNFDYIYEEFNLKTLVNQTVQEVSFLLDEKKQGFVVNINVKNELINGDIIQIKRVICNLISNAITYSLEKSNIYISLEETNEEIIFKIKNQSNYKINNDNLDEFFNKFYSTKKNYRKIGSGLGLYISKHIIETHNGKMTAQKLAENEYEFGFILPSNIPQCQIKNCSM